MKHTLKLLLGWLCFAIGFVGMFVPLLPTVIFWILAAWLFATSAPHLRDRIYRHPRFGRMVHDFLEHGVLSRRGKAFAIGGMTLGVGLSSLLWSPPWPVLAAIVAILVPVAVWLLLRPETLPATVEAK